MINIVIYLHHIFKYPSELVIAIITRNCQVNYDTKKNNSLVKYKHQCYHDPVFFFIRRSS